jgi:hypothetical protein
MTQEAAMAEKRAPREGEKVRARHSPEKYREMGLNRVKAALANPNNRERLVGAMAHADACRQRKRAAREALETPEERWWRSLGQWLIVITNRQRAKLYAVAAILKIGMSPIVREALDDWFRRWEEANGPIPLPEVPAAGSEKS